MDTSAWYALTDVGDTYHAQAAQRVRRMVDDRRRLCISNHVTSETYTMLRVRLGYTAAHRFLQHIRTNPSIERIFIPQIWEEAAEALLQQYQDQDFSYVDATSFVAMRRLNLQEVFTFDHHFSILGFIPIGDDGR